MKIANGIAIDPSKYAMVILTSSDETNWDEAINKYGVNKIISFIGKDELYYIQIVFHNGQNKEFTLDQVTNQEDWTQDQTGLNTAIADISSWLIMA